MIDFGGTSTGAISGSGQGGGLTLAQVELLLLSKGFLQSESFVVGFGGQTVFNVSNEIGNDFLFYEDGGITIRTVNQTTPTRLTATTSVPEGTIVNILY